MTKLYNEEKTEKHPSYGIARFSRVSGGGNFFGTVIKPQHYFTFEIFQGKKEISNLNGEEHFYTDGRLPIISIKMSSAQFTELITTMNIGNGVPVTLTEVNYKRVEECPKQTSPLDYAIEKTDEGIDDTAKFCNDYLNEIKELLKNGNVGKKSINEMIHKIDCVIERQKSDAEFYKKELIETGEKVVAQAKAEIENTTMSIVNRLGLKTLEQLKEVEEKIFIEKKEDESN